MKIILFGASGTLGQRILQEALNRGHELTAVARNTSSINVTSDGLKTANADIQDPESVASVVTGHDVVISAVGPDQSGNSEILKNAAHSLIKGLEKAGLSRLVVVGGAGSLEVAPGVKLLDNPNFPAAFKDVAVAHNDALEIYKSEANNLEWTYVSPAALIQPGERTGHFRLGTDQLLTDAKGQSQISTEDFAVALLDEVENPKHIRQRMSVAY